jgi:hypothetical protein
MNEELMPQGTPAQGDSIATDGILADQPVVTEQPVAAAQEESAPAASQAAPDTVADRNFRALRHERDEAMRRLQEYENRYQPKPQQAQPQEPDLELDFDLNIKDDELVEGKQVKQALKKLVQQQKAFQRQTYETSAESRLRAKYSDFDQVMTLENMQKLSQEEPELAKSINASTDLYDKAASAYKLIKKFGIHQDEPFSADKDRALANTNKPKPLASISPQKGDSPLSRANMFANGLTPDLKKYLLDEMNACAKKY